MKLGAFSVSLNVKDLSSSLDFYKKLGFEKVFGEEKQNWVIVRNGDTTIGLFQGMFENNILTFNPGWDSNAKPLDDFEDVREIQKSLKSNGIKLTSEIEKDSLKGPANLMLIDPDGNTILIDQHVE